MVAGNSFKRLVLNKVAAAYIQDLGVFPLSYAQAKRHEVGDSLADFIRIELEEGVDWTKDPGTILEEAIKRMETARSDIESVISELRIGSHYKKRRRA